VWVRFARGLQQLLAGTAVKQRYERMNAQVVASAQVPMVLLAWRKGLPELLAGTTGLVADLLIGAWRSL